MLPGQDAYSLLRRAAQPVARLVLRGLNLDVGGDPDQSPAQAANEIVLRIIDGLWEEIGNSQVYSGILLVSKFLVGVGLLILFFNVAALLSERSDVRIPDLIKAFLWPVVAIVLLMQPAGAATNQSTVWQASYTLRNVINRLDQTVTAGIFPQGAENPLAILSANYGEESGTISQLSECESLGDAGMRLECVRRTAEAVAGSRSSNESLQLLARNFLNTSQGILGTGGIVLGNLLENVDFEEINRLLVHPFVSLGKRYIESVVSGFFIALYFMFNLLIELSLLLVALLAPLAVGASLIPLGARTIITWISGIVGLGMTKIGFHSLANLSALFAFEQGGFGVNLGIYLLLGFGAPFVAGSIGSFCATTIYQGVLRLGMMVGVMGVGIGGKMAGFGLFLGRGKG